MLLIYTDSQLKEKIIEMIGLFESKVVGLKGTKSNCFIK